MTQLASPPTQAVGDNDVPADVMTAANTIGDAFSTSVSIWRRDEEGHWSHVGVAQGTALSGLPSGPIDAAVLNGVGESGAAQVLPSEHGTLAVVALPTVDGDWSVGVLRVEMTLADQVNRIAADALCRDRLQKQVSGLTAENDSFAVQLTSDLEELTFLRSVSDRMTAAAGGGLVAMARQTLPVLNTTVHAETLAVLSAGKNQRAPKLLHHHGQTIDSQTLRTIVERYGKDTQDAAVVRNWTSNAVSPSDEAPVGVRSLVLVRIGAAGTQFGWLIAVNRVAPEKEMWRSSWQLESDEFGSGEATLMSTTAAILAMQAANMEMIREKEQILVNVVRSLVSAIEAKDVYTRGHSERVALYTRRLAEEMGYLEDESERIYLAALLHDVGKIGVADSTLKKQGKLTDDEYAEISKHPDEGWAILCDMKQLRYVLPGVLHHHERWDGRGYPDKLAGTDIPLDGRVMAVADAYDAMTSDRPYRSGMPSEKAEAIICEGAGTQWDPECVNAFFACLDDIHGIKDAYQQRERRQRKQAVTDEERRSLPHEIDGLPE